MGKKNRLLALTVIGALILSTCIVLIQATDVHASSTPQNPVYRLWNSKAKDHLYTTSIGQRNAAIYLYGFKDEGVAWERTSTPTTVYRLWNASLGDHYYVTSIAARNAAIYLYGYKDEGVAWVDSYPNGPIVYRLWNGANKDHFYTTSITEKNNAVTYYGYTDEGIAWGSASPSAKAITSFTIPNQVGTTTIDESAHTIKLTASYGTDLASLSPTISVSGGTTNPLSGTANNFTNPTTYTVKAGDGTTQAYAVTIDPFPTVTIGNQIWMKNNINTGIMVAGSTNQSNNGLVEKHCYNNDPANCDTYGGLYQWDEAMQYSSAESTQGICPNGYHIPSDSEWKTLEITLGMSPEQVDLEGNRGADEGTKIMPGGSSGLDFPRSGYSVDGLFYGQDFRGWIWTSSESESDRAWQRGPQMGQNSRDRELKREGLSVRCLKTLSITAIGAITGIPKVGETLTAGAVTPGGATVAYQWQIADTVNGSYADIGGANSNTYTPVEGDAGKHIKLKVTGTGGFVGTATSAATAQVDPQDWIPGLAGTPLEGKYILNSDLSTAQTWGPETDCREPYCAQGLDPSYPTYYSLVDDNSVDFSNFPARQACKDIGGRLPNAWELEAIYIDQAHYGNNFTAPLWSSTEESSGIALHTLFDTGYTNGENKFNMPNVRCIKGNALIPISTVAPIEGTPRSGSVLSTGALTPSIATAIYQWQISESLSGEYIDLGGATSNTYTPTQSDVGKYLRVKITGFGGFGGTVVSTSTNQIESPGWISGLTGTPLAGKYVYSSDLSAMYAWGDVAAACVSPQCEVGLDLNFIGSRSLVNPLVNSLIDFSAYPAQSACMSLGGRLPYMYELAAIMQARSSYGNNVQWGKWYNSATEYLDPRYDYTLHTNGSGVSAVWKADNTNSPTRCVKG